MIKKGMILALLLGVCSVEVNAAGWGVLRGVERQLPSLRLAYSTASCSGADVPSPPHSEQPRKWGRYLFAGGALLVGGSVLYGVDGFAEKDEPFAESAQAFPGRLALHVAKKFARPEEFIKAATDQTLMALKERTSSFRGVRITQQGFSELKDSFAHSALMVKIYCDLLHSDVRWRSLCGIDAITYVSDKDLEELIAAIKKTCPDFASRSDYMAEIEQELDRRRELANNLYPAPLCLKGDDLGFRRKISGSRSDYVVYFDKENLVIRDAEGKRYFSGNSHEVGGWIVHVVNSKYGLLIFSWDGLYWYDARRNSVRPSYEHTVLKDNNFSEIFASIKGDPTIKTLMECTIILSGLYGEYFTVEQKNEALGRLNGLRSDLEFKKNYAYYDRLLKQQSGFFDVETRRVEKGLKRLSDGTFVVWGRTECVHYDKKGDILGFLSAEEYNALLNPLPAFCAIGASLGGEVKYASSGNYLQIQDPKDKAPNYCSFSSDWYIQFHNGNQYLVQPGNNCWILIDEDAEFEVKPAT